MKKVLALLVILTSLSIASDKPKQSFFGNAPLIEQSQQFKNAEILKDSVGMYYTKAIIRIIKLDEDNVSIIQFDSQTPFESQYAVTFNNLTLDELNLIRNKIKVFQSEKKVK